MIDGTQCTLQYHVDDVILSHLNKEIILKEIERFEIQFRTKTQDITVTKGKVHEYVGMTLDWSNDSYVKITMYDFLEDILKEVDEKGDMNGTSPTPASDKLFEADENSEKLSEKEADYYHRIVARLLFASKRARPDLLTAVSYLCTRVKSPTISDYNKLKRTIRYIRQTIHLPSLLG